MLLVGTNNFLTKIQQQNWKGTSKSPLKETVISCASCNFFKNYYCNSFLITGSAGTCMLELAVEKLEFYKKLFLFSLFT